MGLTGAADPAPGRAAAGAAARLRRRQDLDRQRHRHGHARPRGRRGDARRPHHQPLELRRRRPTGSGHRRRGARHRGRGRPVGGAAQAHPGGAQAQQSRRRPGAGCSPFPRGGSHPHHEQATLHTRARSRARPRTRRRRVRQRQQRRRRLAASSSTPSTSAAQAAAIKHNDANAKTTLTVGSKNFTEQKVLGEIYAQAFQAAGYKVKKALNLGDEKTALKAVKTDQISGYPEYTGTALLSFLKVPAKDIPTDENEAYEQVKAGLAKQGIEAFPPTPVHLVQRGRPAQEEGRRARGDEDLRPQGQGRPAHALRLAGVPHAPGLPARPRAGLRPEVQEVRARRHRPAPRGADQRAGRRVDRLHDRPADQAQRRGPARGRQGHVPALQLDLPDEDSRRPTRPGPTWRRRSTR